MRIKECVRIDSDGSLGAVLLDLERKTPQGSHIVNLRSCPERRKAMPHLRQHRSQPHSQTATWQGGRQESRERKQCTRKGMLRFGPAYEEKEQAKLTQKDGQTQLNLSHGSAHGDLG